MILRILILTLGYLTTTQHFFAQTDTLWFGHDYMKSTKKNASYFRPYPKKMGAFYDIKQYYINGELCFEGKSRDAIENDFEGDLIIYNEDGEKVRTLAFSNNKLIAEKTEHNGNTYNLTYIDDKPETGTICYDGSPIRLVEFKEGFKVTEQTYYPNKTSIKKQIFYNQGDKEKELSYHINGKRIGELIYDNGKVKEGNLATFHYNKPEIVEKVLHYNNYNYSHTDVYYSNGLPKSIISLEPPISESFYNLKGELLGQITYKGSINEQIYYDGKHITFHRLKGESDQPKSISYYKKGKVKKHEYFYENGVLEKVSVYDSTGYKLEYEASFTERGDTLAYLSYKGYQPWDGINIAGNFKTWYKAGIKIKEYEHYYDSKQVFRAQENDQSKYYSIDGLLIAVMQLKGKNNNKQPYSGVMATHRDSLYNYYTYKHGKIIKIEDYMRNSDTREVYREVKYYDEYDQHQLIKTELFFSNSKKQSETIKEYNQDKTSKFYDFEGNLIGEYDYESKNGTLVSYFDESDQIKTIKIRESGDIVYEKEYKKNYYVSMNESNWFYLFSEFDINDKAVFYTKDGKPRYTLIFKDKKPYSGEVFSTHDNSIYTFKKGKREGQYLKIDTYDTPERIIESGQYKADKKEGVFKYFSGKRLTHIIMYKADLKHGLTKYFDKDGNLISTLEYLEGEPYHGTFKSEKESVIYKKGIKTERFKKNKYEGDKREIFKGDSIYTTTYFPKSEFKKYTYTLSKHKQLNGPVNRFDEKGNLIHQSIFKDGELHSGTVRLKNTSDYNRNVGYYIITKANNTINIEIRQEDDLPILEVKELDFAKNNMVQQYFNLNLFNVYYKDLR